ncbi:MAG: DUF3095 family protein [Bacteroidota bacterium]
MVTSGTKNFYTDLPIHTQSASELMGQVDAFVKVPPDWHIVVTDIKGSTQAVADGRHSLVNLVATGSIIAALNITKAAGIGIAFFFGGDGATLLLPPEILDQTMLALTEHRANTKENFNLDLRLGQVAVQKLYEAGEEIRIARLRMNEKYIIPVILGGGLREAENMIKGTDFVSDLPALQRNCLNLDGMECRWNHIPPPKNKLEVVCLLVQAQDDAQQASVFRNLLTHLDSLYGLPPARMPISVAKLRLAARLRNLNAEMKVRLGKFKLAYLIGNWLRTLFGKVFWNRSASGQTYLQNLVLLSDTLVLDGRINTVMSGTPAQREKLSQILDQMETEGMIHYGLFACPESVMSCYVRDRKDDHIHFVDGSDGGYTQAAKMLKQKLKKT